MLHAATGWNRAVTGNLARQVSCRRVATMMLLAAVVGSGIMRTTLREGMSRYTAR